MPKLKIAVLVIDAALALTLSIAAIRTMSPQPPQNSWRRDIIYRAPTEQKIVALTYDDGPNPKFTPKILNILDRYHVKATFFMIGREMEKYPGVVKDVLRRGHAIGNHTYTHPHDIELDTRSQITGELQKCEDVIYQMTNTRPHIFRPPRGLVDGSVFQIANDEDYQVILWTVSADHHDAPTPEKMAKRVLDHVVPGGIILAHDGTFCTRIKDVEATPLILKELTKQGYRFVTIPELLRMQEQTAKSSPTSI